MLARAGEGDPKAGIDTRALTFVRAAELCTMLRMGSWRPQALYGTPEYQATRAPRAGVSENGSGLRENNLEGAARSAAADNHIARGEAT